MSLTDTAIRAAKPADKPYKKADSGGLFLYITPNGSRLWRMKYRFDGKEKLLSFGDYPTVSLATARSQRDEAKAQLAQGIDPGAQKKETKRAEEQAAKSPFRVVAAEYFSRCKQEGRAAATLDKLEWQLAIVNEHLGNMPVTAITAPGVLGVLRPLERDGKLETARRVRATISRVFRFAIAIGLADSDPAAALRGAVLAPKVTHRAAIVDPNRFAQLLKAIDAYGGQPATKAALRLMPLLLSRPGELRNAEWQEFDLDKAIWTIPASRMKMRREHRVHLPPQAVSILNELRALTGNGTLAFPCERTDKRPISENTLNGALRRMGYRKDEMTAHGFRATASTLLNESGLWHPDAIERQLAHIEKNDVRRAYARGEHWEERVRMMNWWADRLDEWKRGITA